jgi:ABC-type nitrate/sulfonate/bicarbonate transport system substrate-binding protein
MLALGGGGLAALSLAGRAYSQTASELRIQLNWLETADFSAAFAAEKEGYDKAEGIKQIFFPGGPQVDAVQSVAGGTGDVGFGGSIVQMALARINGIPVRMMGALYRNSPAGLISLAENPIRLPQDAVGKRIGLQGGARLSWANILRNNGLDDKQMTIVPVGADVSPLVNKQVDGYWGMAINQRVGLEMRGVETEFMSTAAAGAPGQFDIVFAMEDGIQKRRNDIVSWLKALRKGQEYSMANPDAIGNYVVERSPSLKLDPKQQILQIKAAMDYINPPGKELPLLKIDVEGANVNLDQMLAIGALPRKIELDEFFDGSLVEESYA